ncbi:MAG: thiamine-phosphate kinase [Bacteroidia bacterium]|nr:thiamine-phosphate kinase [Bacteroidia bacterium]
MFENTSPRTELSGLGEFGLIEHLSSFVKTENPESLTGIGDDAAVMDFGNMLTVASTDMLLEGVHFDLSFHPLMHLGYKSVIVNLSDIYAMNAQPKQILVAIALSNRFSLEAVEELYRGINLACNKYHVDLAGGDTTSSSSGLVLSLTAIGSVAKEKIVYRKGAAVNDLICVSGDLGAAYLGLQVLEREKKIFLEHPGIQPDLAGNDYILERQLKPEARKEIIGLLDELNILPTSMIDISDGLSSEIMHLCKAGNTGCVLHEEKLPVDVQTIERAAEFNLNPTVCALNGGEDYELLFTIRQDDYEKILKQRDISVIGYMTKPSEGMHLLDKAGHQVPLKAQGWNAFQKG